LYHSSAKRTKRRASSSIERRDRRDRSIDRDRHTNALWTIDRTPTIAH